MIKVLIELPFSLKNGQFADEIPFTASFGRL